ALAHPGLRQSARGLSSGIRRSYASLLTDEDIMKALDLVEKMAHQGTNGLSDAELLSLFLSSKKGVSAIVQAHNIIEENGGLYALFSRNDHGRVEVAGLSRMQLARLQVGRTLAARAAFERVCQGDVLSSPEHVRRYLQLQFAGRQDEVFGLVLLDNRHRVICYREVGVGTIDSCAVYPRSCVKLVLSANAAACFAVHSHPSGVAEPSDADVRLTRKLSDAMNLVDCRLLDHFICGQGTITSLAERGLM
ncbi:RadC family protein, partial [Maritalea sp.]|uniref:RadC family protein n=1 Tax=Maritalea sp. TaxID=2003361 RepID=UPI003EF1F4CC